MIYASLTNPLLGIYYPLPTEDEIEARLMLNSSSLSKLWCSIYTLVEVDACIERFGGIVLPAEFARKLDYDAEYVRIGMHEVRVRMAAIPAGKVGGAS